MKSFLRYTFLIVAAVGLFGGVLRSQDLLDQLKKANADAVPKYVSPILSGWAADLNSGFYHSADLHDILGFDIGVKVGFAQILDEDKTYKFQMPSTIPNPLGPALVAGVDYDANPSVPTAVGEKGKDVTVGGVDYKNIVEIKTTSTTKTGGQTIVLYRLPGGYNLPAVPLPVPQVNIGLPFGLEVMGRFIPKVKVGDYGKVNFFGFGLRHDIDQYLPLFPIDIAIHFMTQKFNLSSIDDKDILSASAMSYGVEVSKKLLFITLYGGFDIQSSSFTVAAIDGATQTAAGSVPFHVNEFTVDGNNKSRAVVGLRLLLLIINVHAEYSFAKTPMATLGVGLSLR